MGEKHIKHKIHDWLMRITYAEAEKDEFGFKLTGEDLERKTRLAMDKIMVVKSEISENDTKTEGSGLSGISTTRIRLKRPNTMNAMPLMTKCPSNLLSEVMKQ